MKRLAAEARNDAKRRRFDNDGGPTEEERREILKAKARKYEQIKKGDFSGLSQKEIEEAVIDVSLNSCQFEYHWDTGSLRSLKSSQTILQMKTNLLILLV